KMGSTSQRACEAGGRIIAPGVSPGIRSGSVSQPSKRAAEIFSYVASFRIKTLLTKLCRPSGARNLFCAPYPGLAPGATLCRRLRRLVVALVLTAFFGQMPVAHAQTPVSSSSGSANSTQNPTPSQYLDQTNGMTADEAVAYALTHNRELEAARKEIDAARAMSRQARLRANPKLDIEGTRQIPPGKDNSVMATAMLPLELGGRRSARIVVAEREVEVREREVA